MSITQPTDHPPYITYSQARTFDSCPKRWWVEYVQKHPQPPTQQLVVGTVTHTILEHLMTQPPNMRTPQHARQIATRTWLRFTHSDQYRTLDSAVDWSQTKHAIWRNVMSLWKIENPQTIQVTHTETTLQTHLDGTAFKCVIDRIAKNGDTTVIVDYKTGKPPQQTWQHEHDRQLQLYSAAYATQHPDTPIAATLVYLGENPQTRSVPLDRQSVRKAVSWIQQTHQQIQNATRTGEYPTKPGPLCGWCAWLPNCPQGQQRAGKQASRVEPATQQ